MKKSIGRWGRKFNKRDRKIARKFLLLYLAVASLSLLVFFTFQALLKSGTADQLATSVAVTAKKGSWETGSGNLESQAKDLQDCLDAKSDQFCRGTANKIDGCPGVVFGTKDCCSVLTQLPAGQHQLTENCYGGKEIFKDPAKMLTSYILGNKDQCVNNEFTRKGYNPCVFVPKPGYHLVDEGHPNFPPLQIEKDCTPKDYTSTACSEACGGGTRTVTGMTRFCVEATRIEPCNTQPCGKAWNER